MEPTPGDEVPRAGLQRTVVRGVGLASAGQLLTQLLSLGQYLVLARLATPHDFGLLAAGSIVVGIGVLVAESGLLAAVVQRQDRVEEAAATAFVASAVGGLLLALAAVAASPLVGRIFHSDTAAAVAAVLSALILVKQLAVVPNALLQRRFSFFRRVALDPLSTVAGASAAIAGTAAGLGVWGLVLGVYVAAVTDTVLAWAFVRWRPRWRDASYGMWRELARYGRHLLLANGVYRLNVEGRVVEVGHWLGSAVLGQYSMALRLGIQPLAVVVNGTSYVLMPALARLASDPPRFRSATLRSLRSVTLVALPLSLLLIPFGKPATVLLLGEPWAPCGAALAWMAGIGVAGAADTVASEATKAAGRPQWLPWMHMLRTAGVLGVTAALVGWGLNGAALALSIGEFLAAALGIVAIVHVTGAGAGSVLRTFVTPGIAGAAMLCAAVPLRLALDPSHYTPAVGISVLAGEMLLACAAYGAVVAALNVDDARGAVRLVRRSLGRSPA